MARYAHKGSLYFLTTFLVSVAILSLLASISITMIDGGAKLPKPEVNIESSNYMPNSHDNMTILLIGGNEKENTARTFLLLKFNAVKGEIPVLLIPPQTLLDDSGEKLILEDINKLHGSSVTKMIIEANFGISIDRYAGFDIETFIKIADMIGTVEYKIPSDLIVKEASGQITINAGYQLLDGKKTASIIGNSPHIQNDLEREKISSDLIATIINKKMDIVQHDSVDAIFKAAVNLADTDISYADFEARKAPANFMLDLGVQPAYSVLISGNFNEAGNTFVPDKNTFDKIKSKFS